MKLNIIYTILLAFGMTSFYGSCQQEPLFQHNYLNPFIYNPGYAGFNGGVEMGVFRNQKWADFDGGIISNVLSLSTRINDSKSSIGINLNTNNLGLTNKTKAHLAYSYHINISEDLILQPGFSIGLVDQRVNLSGIKGNLIDPVLSESFINNKTGIDANFGLFLNYKDFNFGFSVPQLLGNKLALTDSETYTFKLERQFIVNTSYTFKFENNEFAFFKPDVLVIHSPKLPIHYSTSILVGLTNIGWLGATYKSGYAFAASIGLSMIKNLKIGLAYDFPIGEMATITNSNNFEVALTYAIPSKNNNATAPKKSNLENRLKTVLREQEIRDSINYAVIDSLTTEINVKEIENKELTDENTLINEKHITSQNNNITNNSTDNDTNTSNSNSVPDNNNIKTNESNKTTVKTNNDIVTDNSLPAKYENVQTQSVKVKDDYFTDLLNNSASPNGYYVVSGMYDSKNKAEQILILSKSNFPNSKLIVNQRNQKYYLVLYYSNTINGVIEALMESNIMNDENFSNAWALNYFNNK